MKTYIFVDNYRGFSNSWIPLSRVNFLVGENSTGKTSIIELLENFYYVPFWIELKFGVPGSNPKHFNDIVSASSKKRSKFTIGAISIDTDKENSFKGMLVTYRNFEGRPVPYRVSIIDSGSIRTISGKIWFAKSGDEYLRKEKQITISSDQFASNSLIYIANTHQENLGFKKSVFPKDKEGFPFILKFDDFLFKNYGDKRQIIIPSIFQKNLVELAPIRTKPKRTYDAPQTEFSPEGDHIPYVIRRRLNHKTQAKPFSSFLEKIGNESGLFESISVENYGTDPLSPFKIKIALGKTSLGLDNVGYGVSQALPVVVELFIRPKGTLFTIQQPEVHLHPRAQASIGDLVAELSRSQEKNFVIETHSDFTIDRFRLNIRKNGGIPSQLLFFERTESGNKVSTIEIDNQGSLSNEQPESYREFFFNESLSLLG